MEARSNRRTKRPSPDDGALFTLVVVAKGVIPAGSMAGGVREPQGSPAPVARSSNRASSVSLVRRTLGTTETAMNQRTFQRLDQLDTHLTQMLLELRFATSLFGDGPPQSLLIGSDEIMAAMTRIIRELEVARRLVRCEILTMRR
ncbi:MAG: hypothetical protein ACREPN_01460 [Rudaea sp.]